MDSLVQDLRIAVRSLARRRAFALVAVVTLATGIGATTALFSLVDAVLLRPLPYREPSRLFRVWQAFPEFREQETLRARWDRIGLSYPQYAALREANTVVEQATIFMIGTGDLSGIGNADKARFALTTATLLPTLGLRPYLGRDFSVADEEGEGGDVVMLGYDAWRRWYGADPAVLGGLIKLDGRPYTVIGIMPPELRVLGHVGIGTGPFVAPNVWIPIGKASRLAAGGQGHVYQAIVRLRPGVSADAAQASIVPLLGRAIATYRTNGKPPGGSVEPLGRHETLGARSALWMLLAAAGIVLLVACGNVANLMLSDVVPRGRELAMRATLGADRPRLVRLLLTESLVRSPRWAASWATAWLRGALTRWLRWRRPARRTSTRFGSTTAYSPSR